MKKKMTCMNDTKQYKEKIATARAKVNVQEKEKRLLSLSFIHHLAIFSMASFSDKLINFFSDIPCTILRGRGSIADRAVRPSDGRPAGADPRRE